jgi:hypothetical protein
LKAFTSIAFVALALVFSCKKEKTTTLPEPAPTSPANSSPLPDCASIPQGPQPFGWKDSSANEDENVNFFRAQPYKAGEYIYCVNGNIFPQNRMYLYNYSSQQRILLGERDAFLPSLNINGWMVYSKPDKNIYKVKLNGDSLTQLTSGGLYANPQWDPIGKYIYCYQQTTSLSPSYLLKLNASGQTMAAYPTLYPNSVPSKLQDNAYLLTVNNNRLTVILRNLLTNAETLITASGLTLNGTQNDFFNLCADPKEEFLYWNNTKGILRCNIANKQVDTLFKNCGNITYLNPIISENSEELTFCCKILKPLNSIVLYRAYRSFEYNVINKQWRELDFFP